MNPDEITLSDHEARLRVIEDGCGRCPKQFDEIKESLGRISLKVDDLLLREARQSGFWSGVEKVLYGAGGGGIVGLFIWAHDKLAGGKL